MSKTEILEISEQLRSIARVNGKLKFISNLSDWLKTQANQIDKEDLIQYLQISVAGEADE